MATMYDESFDIKNQIRFSPSIANKQGAVGLIQFMPGTYKGFPKTKEEMMAMTNIEQLDYVKKFFEPYKGKMKSYADLHLVAFFPIALNKPSTFIFQYGNLSAKIIAEQNSPYDINKDLQITNAEFYEFEKSRHPEFFK